MKTGPQPSSHSPYPPPHPRKPPLPGKAARQHPPGGGGPSGEGRWKKFISLPSRLPLPLRVLSSRAAAAAEPPSSRTSPQQRGHQDPASARSLRASLPPPPKRECGDVSGGGAGPCRTHSPPAGGPAPSPPSILSSLPPLPSPGGVGAPRRGVPPPSLSPGTPLSAPPASPKLRIPLRGGGAFPFPPLFFFFFPPPTVLFQGIGCAQ